MFPRLLVGALACLVFAVPAPVLGKLRSGPQVGARNDRNGFTPKWITGPCAGKRLCPV